MSLPPGARIGAYEIVSLLGAGGPPPHGRMLGIVTAGRDPSSPATPPQIDVVLNWFEELKQRVPVK